jgi:hypothetical protein
MKLLFWLLLISAFCMGIYACLPAPEQSGLMSVHEIQQELVRRGHDIKIDGKFGKNTDYALTVELSKEIK